MSTSTIEIPLPRLGEVTVSDDSLAAELSDGRTISVPLDWYPRLVHATAQERDNWHLIGDGEGVHWPDLDEDISVGGLLAGRPSGEGGRSLKRWLRHGNRTER
ncbi:MAG: DUF2442 domain-containing protein [bacterium]|nr:DUF2442 domain-containing protein [bacterium]